MDKAAKGMLKECMAQFLSFVDGSKAPDYGNAWSAVANNRGVAESLLFLTAVASSRGVAASLLFNPAVANSRYVAASTVV